MGRSKLADVLHAVDPKLKIVSGHHRHKNGGKPRGLTEEDWEKSKGDPCKKCGGDDVFLLQGFCRTCHAQNEKSLAKKTEVRARVKALTSVFRSRRAAGRHK